MGMWMNHSKWLSDLEIYSLILFGKFLAFFPAFAQFIRFRFFSSTIRICHQMFEKTEKNQVKRKRCTGWNSKLEIRYQQLSLGRWKKGTFNYVHLIVRMSALYCRVIAIAWTDQEFVFGCTHILPFSKW